MSNLNNVTEILLETAYQTSQMVSLRTVPLPLCKNAKSDTLIFTVNKLTTWLHFCRDLSQNRIQNISAATFTGVQAISSM